MNPITETHYTVNDVGNANCIFIDRFKHRNYESTLINVCNIHFFINFHEGDLKRRNLLIDFGYDHTKHLDYNLKEQARNADEFLLSHYHLDHYKGLEKMEDKSLYIEKIYYPHIPQMHNRYTLLKACYFICIVDGNDLINLLKQKNKTTDFIKKNVFIGDTIFDDRYEVVWPPKNLEKGSTMYTKLQNGIKRIDDTLNEHPEIKNIWQHVKQSSIIDPHTLLLKEDNNDIQEFINKHKEKIKDHKDILEKVKFEIRQITNRFSICVYKKDEFLFLGDLEKEEVEMCMKRLFEKNGNKKVFVKYFITPHHGTKNHYSPALEKYLTADFVISSNGEKENSDYAKEYKKLVSGHGHEHRTYNDSTFTSLKKQQSSKTN